MDYLPVEVLLGGGNEKVGVVGGRGNSVEPLEKGVVVDDVGKVLVGKENLIGVVCGFLEDTNAVRDGHGCGQGHWQTTSIGDAVVGVIKVRQQSKEIGVHKETQIGGGLGHGTGKRGGRNGGNHKGGDGRPYTNGITQCVVRASDLVSDVEGTGVGKDLKLLRVLIVGNERHIVVGKEGCECWVRKRCRHGIYIGVV